MRPNAVLGGVVVFGSLKIVLLRALNASVIAVASGSRIEPAVDVALAGRQRDAFDAAVENRVAEATRRTGLVDNYGVHSLLDIQPLSLGIRKRWKSRQDLLEGMLDDIRA
jgi:hypothetical protein